MKIILTQSDGTSVLPPFAPLVKLYKGDFLSRKQRLKSKTGYYHIMCFGNECRNIFDGDQDKMKFIVILSEKQLVYN